MFKRFGSQSGDTIAIVVISLGVFFAVYGVIAGMFPSAKFTPYGSEKFPPTESVETLNTAPQYAYKEIGEITARGEDDRRVLSAITKRAKEVGAHAIIIQDTTRHGAYAVYRVIAIRRK